MVAALAIAGYYHWETAQREQARAEASQRQRLREHQVRAVVDDLNEAERWLEEGEPRMVLTILRHMDEKLQIVASFTNLTGDAEDAQRIATLRDPVRRAIAATTNAADDPEGLQTVRDSFADIRAAFARDAMVEPAELDAGSSPRSAQTAASARDAASEERRLVRRRQLEAVAGDIDEAARFVADGHPQYALEKLQEMEQKLHLVASAARASGDADDAERVLGLHGRVVEAGARIEGAEGESERLEAAETALADLRSVFAEYRQDEGTTGD
jgi:hypothetical protein